MKINFKIAFYILVIVLISIIAFVGVYSKQETNYKSLLPEYKLDTDIVGKRIVYLNINSDTQEKIFDKDGKEVNEIPEGANEEDYTKQTVKINADEAYTKENYKKVKRIIEGRLKAIGVEDYIVRLDEETGDVVVELEDSSATDTYIQYLTLKGDFKIIDSEDETVLLDRADLKKANIFYDDSSSERTIYLRILFNKNGAKKLKEVSIEYRDIDKKKEEEKQKEEQEEKNEQNNSVNEIGNEVTENKVVDNEVNSETTTQQNNEEVENEEETQEEEEQKLVQIIIEGYNMLSSPSAFADVMDNGELAIPIGSGSDYETVYNYMRQASLYSVLLNNEEMPLTYQVNTIQYIASETDISIGIVALVIIAFIVITYLILKFKLDGLIGGITFIGTIGLLAILLRYTDSTVSYGSFAGIAIIMFTQMYFIINILNKIKDNSAIENIKLVTLKVYIKKIDIVLILIITSIVFTFINEVKVSSIGMSLFYGIISIAISNLVFMRNMLIEKYKKLN